MQWKLRPEFFTGASDQYKLNDAPLTVDENGCFEYDGAASPALMAFATHPDIEQASRRRGWLDFLRQQNAPADRPVGVVAGSVIDGR
jgi:hypothetical protein